jgi:glutathione reductase (NADPH)
VPDLNDLALDVAGVSATRHGIEVDSGMRSVSTPRVFSAGDAAAVGVPLTPVGVAQARVAIRNIVAPGTATFDPPVVPSAVFGSPPLASVGISERQAADAGLDVEIKLTDTSGWLSSQRVGLTHAGAKTVLERGTGRLLGAQVLGHNAEELINLFALAITREMTAEQLKAVLWAYPTATSEIVYLV